MKKSMIFASMLLAANVNAYEYKNIKSTSQTEGNAQFLATVIKFESTDLSSIQMIKAKQNFARCSIDEAAKDVIEAGLGFEVLSSISQMIYKYHVYGDINRDFKMQRSDVVYVEELNFRCIDETPDKESTIFSYVMSSSMFKAECSDNPKCFMPKKLKYFEKLKTKYNIGN